MFRTNQSITELYCFYCWRNSIKDWSTKLIVNLFYSEVDRIVDAFQQNNVSFSMQWLLFSDTSKC